MSDPSRPVMLRPAVRLRRALLGAFAGVGVLWMLAALQGASGVPWIWLGVLPRTWIGLPGIVTAPLVHDSWNHLMANTPALLGLGLIALYGYPRATRYAVPLIWVLSGLGVWLFARDSFHIGISGVNHGLLFFILGIALLRRDPLSIILALLVFVLFGSMATGIFPRAPGISFEYHLFGAIAGVLAALLLFRVDPVPVLRPRSQDTPEESKEPPDPQPTPSSESVKRTTEPRSPTNP